MSTFSGIEVGKKGMLTHQSALNVMGHNVANLNTDGYSRQRVKIATEYPLDVPSLSRAHAVGQMGQGSVVSRVERVFDILHENQILSTADELGYWDVRNFYLQKIQAIYAEPNEVSLRDSVDRFWVAWQDLSVNPESLAHRSVVVEQGVALAESIRGLYERLYEQRVLLNEQVKTTVDEINQKSERISSIGKRIVMSRATGDEPNDLLDLRDQIVRELAELVPVTVEHRDSDEFQIHVRGRVLVQGELTMPLTLSEIQSDPGMLNVKWNEKNLERSYQEKQGKLFSLIELRDNDVRREIQKINSFAANLADMINDLHRLGITGKGIGGVDFFTQFSVIEDVTGNYDSDGDGQFDSTYLFRLTGSNNLSLTTPVGVGGVMIFDGKLGRVQVAYDPSDTVERIIRRINYSDSGVVAHLDNQGYLVLRAVTEFGIASKNPDFVIRHIEDSGQFLVGYAGILRNIGEDGAYNYNRIDAVQDTLRIDQGVKYAVSPLTNPAAWMIVNSRVVGDVNEIATSFPLSTGDVVSGSNTLSLAIADLRHAKVMVDKITSFDDFFADNVLLIGVKGSNAENSVLDLRARMKYLDDISRSISGVNLNEEFTDLVKFQHGFSASARFVSEMDKILDTIINRLGV